MGEFLSCLILGNPRGRKYRVPALCRRILRRSGFGRDDRIRVCAERQAASVSNLSAHACRQRSRSLTRANPGAGTKLLKSKKEILRWISTCTRGIRDCISRGESFGEPIDRGRREAQRIRNRHNLETPRQHHSPQISADERRSKAKACVCNGAAPSPAPLAATEPESGRRASRRRLFGPATDARGSG